MLPALNRHFVNVYFVRLRYVEHSAWANWGVDSTQPNAVRELKSTNTKLSKFSLLSGRIFSFLMKSNVSKRRNWIIYLFKKKKKPTKTRYLCCMSLLVCFSTSPSRIKCRPGKNTSNWPWNENRFWLEKHIFEQNLLWYSRIFFYYSRETHPMILSINLSVPGKLDRFWKLNTNSQ